MDKGLLKLAANLLLQLFIDLEIDTPTPLQKDGDVGDQAVLAFKEVEQLTFWKAYPNSAEALAGFRITLIGLARMAGSESDTEIRSANLRDLAGGAIVYLENYTGGE